MRRFPADFSELLNARGRRVLTSAKPAEDTRFMLTDSVMDRAAAGACVALLNRRLYPLLRRVVTPIPRNSISSMTRNYSEKLPKIVSMKTCFLQSRRYPAYKTAEDIGLIAMLRSECLHRFAESATGLSLCPPTFQAICYEHGDYAGPHNDHHPQEEDARNGYVDLHLMFGNDAVEHQWIVYEQDRHLSQIRNINLQGGIAVYRLPFWHYTTPLAAKPGREHQARRWLLLASFYIQRGRTAA